MQGVVVPEFPYRGRLRGASPASFPGNPGKRLEEEEAAFA